MAQIRFSIANLAWYARNMITAERVQFGILNPAKLAKGVKQYMALGGGAMLTQQGKEFLEKEFGATDFEPEGRPGVFDARFRADAEHLEPIFRMFGLHQPAFELNPTLDIMEELSGKEHPESGPGLLKEKDLERVFCTFRFSIRQAPAKTGEDTSSRASDSLATRRLFRVCELQMPEDVYLQFVSSPGVKVLSEEELRSTQGGATAGVGSDGTPIQNNLFLV